MEEEKKTNKRQNKKFHLTTPTTTTNLYFWFQFFFDIFILSFIIFPSFGLFILFRACYAVVTWTPCYMPPLAFPFNVFGAYSIRFHRETLERKRERETGVEKRRGKFLSRERERKRTEPRRSMKHDPPHSFFFFTGEGRWKTGSN